jgi:hypothetical protein
MLIPGGGSINPTNATLSYVECQVTRFSVYIPPPSSNRLSGFPWFLYPGVSFCFAYFSRARLWLGSVARRVHRVCSVRRHQRPIVARARPAPARVRCLALPSAMLVKRDRTLRVLHPRVQNVSDCLRSFACSQCCMCLITGALGSATDARSQANCVCTERDIPVHSTHSCFVVLLPVAALCCRSFC